MNERSRNPFGLSNELESLVLEFRDEHAATSPLGGNDDPPSHTPVPDRAVERFLTYVLYAAARDGCDDLSNGLGRSAANSYDHVTATLNTAADIALSLAQSVSLPNPNRDRSRRIWIWTHNPDMSVGHSNVLFWTDEITNAVERYLDSTWRDAHVERTVIDLLVAAECVSTPEEIDRQARSSGLIKRYSLLRTYQPIGWAMELSYSALEGNRVSVTHLRTMLEHAARKGAVWPSILFVLLDDLVERGQHVLPAEIPRELRLGEYLNPLKRT